MNTEKEGYLRKQQFSIKIVAWVYIQSVWKFVQSMWACIYRIKLDFVGKLTEILKVFC